MVEQIGISAARGAAVEGVASEIVEWLDSLEGDIPVALAGTIPADDAGLALRTKVAAIKAKALKIFKILDACEPEPV